MARIGRPKGSPNKLTEERARQATLALGKPIAPTAKLAKEVLEEAMMHFRALAGKYQVKLHPDDASKPKDQQRWVGDEAKFERYMRLAGDMADRLAPYQSPRLAAVAVQQLPPLMPEEMTDDQLRAAIAFEAALAAVGSDGGRTIKTIN
jgi:hypothetical protein